jgi:hypothetical protein
MALAEHAHMRNAWKILPILLLAGCASMSKSECLTADWNAVGYEDGARGAPAAAVSSRRSACARKASVAPDMDAYLAGRELGLKQYCRPTNGFIVGSRGETYEGVCSGAQADPFVAEYQSGRLLFDMQREAAVAEQEFSQAQTELWNVKRRISEVETALISPTTRHPDRVEYLLEMKDLMQEKSELQRRVAALDRRVAAAQADLSDYRAFLAEAPDPNGAMRPVQASY